MAFHAGPCYCLARPCSALHAGLCNAIARHAWPCSGCVMAMHCPAGLQGSSKHGFCNGIARPWAALHAVPFNAIAWPCSGLAVHSMHDLVVALQGLAVLCMLGLARNLKCHPCSGLQWYMPLQALAWILRAHACSALQGPCRALQGLCRAM